MPAKSLKSFAKKQGVALKDVERYWKETKKGMKKEPKSPKDYQYLMGVVKKRVERKKNQNETFVREVLAGKDIREVLIENAK